jgi:hypothetical protein
MDGVAVLPDLGPVHGGDDEGWMWSDMSGTWTGGTATDVLGLLGEATADFVELPPLDLSAGATAPPPPILLLPLPPLHSGQVTPFPLLAATAVGEAPAKTSLAAEVLEVKRGQPGDPTMVTLRVADDVHGHLLVVSALYPANGACTSGPPGTRVPGFPIVFPSMPSTAVTGSPKVLAWTCTGYNGRCEVKAARVTPGEVPPALPVSYTIVPPAAPRIDVAVGAGRMCVWTRGSSDWLVSALPALDEGKGYVLACHDLGPVAMDVAPQQNWLVRLFQGQDLLVRSVTLLADGVHLLVCTSQGCHVVNLFDPLAAEDLRNYYVAEEIMGGLMRMSHVASAMVRLPGDDGPPQLRVAATTVGGTVITFGIGPPSVPGIPTIVDPAVIRMVCEASHPAAQDPTLFGSPRPDSIHCAGTCKQLFVLETGKVLFHDDKDVVWSAHPPMNPMGAMQGPIDFDDALTPSVLEGVVAGAFTTWPRTAIKVNQMQPVPPGQFYIMMQGEKPDECKFERVAMDILIN